MRSDYDVVEASIFYKGGTMFWLKFSDGKHMLVDLLPIIRNTPAFQPLLADGKKELANFTLANGTLTWLNETLDIAPERLYSQRDARSEQYIWMR